MPSVSVGWTGRCPDHATQTDLCRSSPVSNYFDQTIQGRILVSGYLFDDDATIPEVLHAVEDASGQRASRKKLYALQNATLYGIEFRLFDGRHLYPGDDRISFVFLRVSDCPSLDGRIVHVEDRATCEQFENGLIKQAEWFLEKPHIHLRYYCEDATGSYSLNEDTLVVENLDMKVECQRLK